MGNSETAIREEDIDEDEIYWYRLCVIIQEPAFELMPENRTALDLYEKVVSLSGFSFSGESDFSKLEFVLENIVGDMEMTKAEFGSLMRRLVFIRGKFAEYHSKEQEAKMKAGGK